MTTKLLIISVVVTWFVQCLQISPAETLTLQAITENLIKKTEDEISLYRQKLMALEKLIVATQTQIDIEKNLIARQTLAIGRYQKLMTSKARDYLEAGNLKKAITRLNSSYILSKPEFSDDILVISERIFLSNGNYLEYLPSQDTYKKSELLPDLTTQTHAGNFQFIANEIQLLAVPLGKDQEIIKNDHLDERGFSFLKFAKLGGIIGQIIIVCGLIVLILAIQNLRRLHKFSRNLKDKEQLKCSVFAEFVDSKHYNLSLEKKEFLLTKILHRQNIGLRGSIDYIRFIATISPMLGLLGTVSGLVITFQAINLAGTNESSIVAAGISQALTTTILGLVVAVPSLLVFTLLSNKVKRIEETLELVAYDLVTNEND